MKKIILAMLVTLPVISQAQVYVHNQSSTDLIFEINAATRNQGVTQYGQIIKAHSGQWVDLGDVSFKNIVLKRVAAPRMVSYEFSEWTITEPDFCPYSDIGFLLDVKRGQWIMGGFSHRAVVMKAVSIDDDADPLNGKNLKFERIAESSQWYVF